MEEEAGGSLEFQGQPGLGRKFQESHFGWVGMVGTEDEARMVKHLPSILKALDLISSIV